MKNQMVAMLGSMGIGLVWGWLAGCLSGRLRKPRTALPLIFITGLLISGQMAWFFALPEVLCLWVALLFAFITVVAMRHVLVGRRATQLRNEEV
jgi:hypothetical protein